MPGNGEKHENQPQGDTVPAVLFAAAMRRILARIPPPPVIVSALSGGMDSVVLLHLLAAWRDNLPPGCRFVAAHLNHGLRGTASVGDREHSRALALRLAVEFAALDVDAARVARDGGMGLEEAGRLLRYRFFHELAGPGGLVLTGHHADDQAETILMHLRRGAHRRGLSGMRELAGVPIPPDMKVAVGRPLLAAERSLLHAYAVENRLEWREDETNRDPSFSRNRIRLRIIPALEAILPGFRRRLLERAEAIGREEEAMTERGRALAESHARREHGGRFFLLDDEAAAEPERLLYAFRHVVEEELGMRLPYGAVLSRLSELAGTGRLGETLSLPSRLRVRRESDGLFFFFPRRDAGDAFGEFILPDPPFAIRACGMDVRAEWVVCPGMPPEADMADPCVEWLNPAGIRWPLRLRPPRPGERFRPMGSAGSRKIQDILVDCKLPRRKRDAPRVLADHAGAIWLWPLRLAHRVRLPGGPLRALRVEIRE